MLEDFVLELVDSHLDREDFVFQGEDFLHDVQDKVLEHEEKVLNVQEKDRNVLEKVHDVQEKGLNVEVRRCDVPVGRCNVTENGRAVPVGHWNVVVGRCDVATKRSSSSWQVSPFLGRSRPGLVWQVDRSPDEAPANCVGPTLYRASKSGPGRSAHDDFFGREAKQKDFDGLQRKKNPRAIGRARRPCLSLSKESGPVRIRDRPRTISHRPTPLRVTRRVLLQSRADDFFEPRTNSNDSGRLPRKNGAEHRTRARP